MAVMDATAVVGSVEPCPFTYQAAFCRVINLRRTVLFKGGVYTFEAKQKWKYGTISLENIKAASMKNATNAMESRILDFFGSLNALHYRRTDFDEFRAATLSVHQLEALDR
ncbi:hypothetical protein HN51_059731 [Arachis hypogaea]